MPEERVEGAQGAQGVHPSVQRILSFNIAQRTPEWYSYRSKRVTASEVSIVIAQGRGSETLLRKKKCGSNSSSFSTECTRIGTENEGNIVGIYKEMYPDVVVYHDLSVVPHKTEDYVAASLDACTNTGINVEIKTCFKSSFTTVPKSYRDQVQLQMEVADLDHTHLVYQYINMPGKPVVVHDIPRSTEWFRQNAPILKKFVQDLEEFTPFDLVLLNYQYGKRREKERGKCGD